VDMAKKELIINTPKKSFMIMRKKAQNILMKIENMHIGKIMMNIQITMTIIAIIAK